MVLVFVGEGMFGGSVVSYFVLYWVELGMLFGVGFFNFVFVYDE